MVARIAGIAVACIAHAQLVSVGERGHTVVAKGGGARRGGCMVASGERVRV